METNGVPSEAEERRSPPPSFVNEFDWDATEYWVKELKRRWSLAKADAPEVNFPVLDTMALELTSGLGATADAAVDWLERDGEPLDESLLLTESGVVLGEMLVMPSETLFDEERHASTASALGLELAERDVGAVAFDESAVIDTDPFIEELLSLIPARVDDEGPYESLLESAELRDVPAAYVTREEGTATPELVAVPRGVQPLVPLQLELTPTPAAVSPWSELTAALSRHLLNGGYTRAAALIGPLLSGELVDFSRVDPGAVELLVCDGIAEMRGGRPLSTATFRQSAKAFREEFATGGLNTSDALFWLSQVVMGLTGGAADEEAIEAELRGLGVAKLLEWAA